MKKILVSGGASGIGASLVQRLISEGHLVYNLDIKSNGITDPLYREFIVDLSSFEEVKQLIEQFKEEETTFDGIAAIAGVGYTTSFDELSIDEFSHQVNLNLHITYHLIKETSDMLADPASIVTISSTSSLGGDRTSIAYGTAKAGIIGMTKNLARELGVKNVRVNSVLPGPVDTPMFNDHSTSMERTLMKSLTPLNGIAKPEYVSNVINFLLHDESLHITGQVLTVDGGLSIAYKPVLN